MSRPPLEVADLVSAAGNAFIERSRKWISWKHIKVLLAIVRCRTAALGGHLDECTRCGHRAISFNSCQVSDRGPGTLGRRTSKRTSPDALRPCGLHTASSTA